MIHTTPDAGKFRRLVRKLRPMIGDVPCAVETVVVGLLERMWHIGVSSAIRGNIGKFDDEEIAEMMGWHGDAARLIDVLCEESWLDRCDTHRLLIHDWHEHAPRHVKANAKKQGGILTPSSERKATPCVEFEPLRESPKDLKEVTPNLTKPNLTSPPAPPPAAKGGDSRRSQAWKGVEEDLLKCGVVAAGKAVDAASTNGCRPDDVIAVIGYWRCSKPRWGAGALYQRILILRPEQDHTELWAEPSEEFVAAENRERSVKSQVDIAAKRESAAKEKAAEKERLAALETQFGQKIDAMSADEIRDLVRREFPETADVELSRYRGGRVSGLLRESLLTHFSFAPKEPTLVLEPQ